jgi:hypothetical protein
VTLGGAANRAGGPTGIATAALQETISDALESARLTADTLLLRPLKSSRARGALVQGDPALQAALHRRVTCLVTELAVRALWTVQERRRLLVDGEVEAEPFAGVNPPSRAFLANEYDLQHQAFEIADCEPLSDGVRLWLAGARNIRSGPHCRLDRRGT